VYIAQPPLYKVKAGREERYLKDEQEEAQYMMQLALKDAEVIPAADAAPIKDDTLSELARQYMLAEAVISRLARIMDEQALSVLARGQAALDLHDAASAQASALALQAALTDPLRPNEVTVTAEYDDVSESQRIVLRRQHHGNVRVTVFDADFVAGADYAVLARAADVFQGLVGDGAIVARGAGDKRKEAPVSSFRQAMTWLLSEAERGISKQRYKGLGEMNPEQLWETTMDPTVRRLLRVQIEDAIAADEIFTTLMGDHVEPRRAFIEAHALTAVNIDV